MSATATLAPQIVDHFPLRPAAKRAEEFRPLWSGAVSVPVYPRAAPFSPNFYPGSMFMFPELERAEFRVVALLPTQFPAYYFDQRAGLVAAVRRNAHEIVWLIGDAAAGSGELTSAALLVARQMQWYVNSATPKLFVFPPLLSGEEAKRVFIAEFNFPELTPLKPWKRIKAGIVKRVRVNKTALVEGGPEHYFVEFKGERHTFAEVEFLGRSKMVWREDVSHQGCIPTSTRSAYLETSAAIRVR